jgi:glycosyltransferase involved in cell wall biosynthesis
MPCFNQGSYLAEALESVICQSFSSWECIIINDGSTDESESVALSYAQKDFRIKYIFQQNAGVAAARNRGIESARGKYILPLDADDKLGDLYIEACVNCFSDPDVKLAYGKAYYFGDVNTEWILADYSFDKLLQANLIFATALYLKSDWQRIGGYDENMKDGYEDWEFWINLLQDGGTVKCDPTGIFHYRIKESSRNADVLRSGDKIKQLKEYVFNKHLRLYNTESHYSLYQKVKRMEDRLSHPEKYLTLRDLARITFRKAATFVKSAFDKIKSS